MKKIKNPYSVKYLKNKHRHIEFEDEILQNDIEFFKNILKVLKQFNQLDFETRVEWDEEKTTVQNFKNKHFEYMIFNSSTNYENLIFPKNINIFHFMDVCFTLIIPEKFKKLISSCFKNEIDKKILDETCKMKRTNFNREGNIFKFNHFVEGNFADHNISTISFLKKAMTEELVLEDVKIFYWRDQYMAIEFINEICKFLGFIKTPKLNSLQIGIRVIDSLDYKKKFDDLFDKIYDKIMESQNGSLETLGFFFNLNSFIRNICISCISKVIAIKPLKCLKLYLNKSDNSKNMLLQEDFFISLKKTLPNLKIFNLSLSLLKEQILDDNEFNSLSSIFINFINNNMRSFSFCLRGLSYYCDTNDIFQLIEQRNFENVFITFKQTNSFSKKRKIWNGKNLIKKQKAICIVKV